MTDREKRYELDRKIKFEHPNYTKEEVVQAREIYIKKHCDNLRFIELPQLEYRETSSRPMTLDSLVAEVKKKHIDREGIISGSMFIVLGVLAALAASRSGSVGPSMLLAAMPFFCLGIFLLWGTWKKRQEGVHIVGKIQAGEFQIRSYEVLDIKKKARLTRHRGRYRAECSYYLHLVSPGSLEPWVLACDESAYRSVREGDIAYLVYCNDSDKPCFIFQNVNWVPDEQIKSMIDASAVKVNDTMETPVTEKTAVDEPSAADKSAVATEVILRELVPEDYTPMPHYLLPGTLLQERYLVGRVLSQGGSGITYIGYDLKLGRKVAIKEYFPSGTAQRVGHNCVEPKQEKDADYMKGRIGFLKLAQALGLMEGIPAVVQGLDYLEMYGTAYLVMEYLDGVTLRQLVMEKGRIPAEELLAKMKPLMEAIDTFHNKNVIHYDIAPWNIMRIRDGSLKLFGFFIDSVYIPSWIDTISEPYAMNPYYTPVEWYRNKEQMCGPWTDVYTLSATIYYCLTGQSPPRAPERLLKDELIPPRKLGVDLTEQQERALLRGMELRPEDRFQTMREMIAALYGEYPFHRDDEPPMVTVYGGPPLDGLCFGSVDTALPPKEPRVERGFRRFWPFGKK